MIGERLSNTNETKNEDAFDIFGKNIAFKLRTLPRETKLYTEKLINDLLFEAEMGNVNRNTKIVTNNSATSVITNTNAYQSLPAYNNDNLNGFNTSSYFETFQPL